VERLAHLQEIFSSRPPSSMLSLHLLNTVQREDSPSPPLTSWIAGSWTLSTGMGKGEGEGIAALAGKGSAIRAQSALRCWRQGSEMMGNER
jgi:hypothetical protein